MARSDDHYGLLGVSQSASMLEIRRAYRRLTRRHHPDRNAEPDSPERFRKLAGAYAVLNDPVRRARYDHTIQPPVRRNAPPAKAAGFDRRGVLELSACEARLVATASLALTTLGATIVLPAGLADGDRITVTVGDVRAVLTVRVGFAQKS